MKYKELFVRSYARSGSNFIINNTFAINNNITIHKSPWWELEKQNLNSVTVTVLRDPREVIVSDIAMSMYDVYSGTDDLKKINYDHSIFSFQEYMNLLKKNINNVIPFTFEQITKNSEQSFKIFLNQCGHKENFKFPNVEIKEKISFNQLMKKKQIFLPSSKSLDIYTDIKDYVDNNKILDCLVNEYKECIDVIYKRQLDF